MAENAGLIFLSHAKEDKPFVDKVKSMLDTSVLFYDIRSIAPGQDSVSAMRGAVSSASVFVLFHSPNANSHWIRYEKDLAEITRIKSPTMQILVCPLDGESYKTLPEWMQRYMTTLPSFKPNDIARTIDHLYTIANKLGSTLYEGREDLERDIALDIRTAPAKLGCPLNVILLAGVQGMGRGAIGKSLVRRAFLGMRPAGPVFDLPDAADAVDWHLTLYEDLNGKMTAIQMAQQMDAFPEAEPDKAADFLVSSLAHWGELNQVVTIRCRWGLRDRGRDIKPWATSLFGKLKTTPSIKLILISDRRLPSDKLAYHQNVRQYEVLELPDRTIEYILTQSIRPQYSQPEKLELIAERVHGHPATANHVSFLVNGGMTLDSLCEFPKPIHAFEDRTLERVYKSGVLTPTQSQILRLLSWLPKLSGDILQEVFPDVKTAELFEQLWDLNEYSLITQAEGGHYRVPAIVSSTFRRFSGTEDPVLVRKVTGVLKERFDTGHISVDLIDSLVIGIVDSEGSLPEHFRSIVTPARLATVVEEQYNRGIQGENVETNVHFKLAAQLTHLALAMNCPDDTLENILFLGADALVRTGQYPKDLLPIMYKKGFSAAHYIEGSYLYHIKRDYDGAAEQILQALNAGHFRRRSVRLLARIYLRSGKFGPALEALDRIGEAQLLRDTGLVIMKVRALRGLRRREDAQGLLQRIGNVDDDFGDLAIYKTGQAIRDANWPVASKHLTVAQRAPRSNKVTLKFLECAIAIETNDFSQLPEACALANAAGREADAFQLQARAAVVSNDWRAAERYLSQIRNKDYFDLAVELRMLDQKLEDAEVKRDPVRVQEAETRKEEVLRGSLNTIEGSRF